MFKSGTTSLQGALHAARKDLRSHGVRYPGKARHHGEPALAITGITLGWADNGGMRTDRRHWDALVAEVAQARAGRVIISAERLSEATEDAAREVVDSLGRSQVHIVTTVRPFAKLLPSSWQQYVKNGQRRTYEEWLRGVLGDPPDPAVTPGFRPRHDLVTVLRRWQDAAGPGRMTLIILDGQDRGALFRHFEELLALPPATLTDDLVRDDNRSMTLAETELVRRVSLEARRKHVTWPVFNDAIRVGLVKRMVANRTPGPDEPRIATPPWALERAAEIGHQMAEGIATLGIDVRGELSALSDVSGVPVADDTETQQISLPLDAAVEAALGVMSGSLGRGPYFRSARKSLARKKQDPDPGGGVSKEPAKARPGKSESRPLYERIAGRRKRS
jgi:hypothetical protein